MVCRLFLERFLQLGLGMDSNCIGASSSFSTSAQRGAWRHQVALISWTAGRCSTWVPPCGMTAVLAASSTNDLDWRGLTSLLWSFSGGIRLSLDARSLRYFWLQLQAFFFMCSARLDGFRAAEAQGFQARCLRKILGVKPTWIARMSKQSVLTQAGQRLHTKQLL